MNYVLETQELTKMYGNTTVVNRVSMHVPEGKIYGLLGRNGAGKTTTMKMLLRMIRITNGKVVLFGKEKNNRKDYQKIGSIIETPGFLPNYNGYHNLEFLYCINHKKNKHILLLSKHLYKIIIFGMSK